MPIFDQYEIEPVNSYSGSYTDNVIINNPILENNSRILGIKIGSKLNGIDNKINLINLSYEDRLDYVSGTNSGKSTQNLYSQYVTDENYLDSYPPNFLDLHLLNAKIPNFGSTVANESGFGFLSESLKINRPGISNNNIPIIFAPKGSRTVTNLTDSPSAEFINFDWKESPWAFKSKYKGIQRLEKFKYQLNFPITSTTKSFFGTDIGSTTCTSIGSFYWVLPSDQNLNQISSPTLFGTTGSNVSNIFFEHINMPCGDDIYDIVYNSSKDSTTNDLYLAAGAYKLLAYSFNGVKWHPLSGEETNDVSFANSIIPTGRGIKNIAYSIYGNDSLNAYKHKKYIMIISSGAGIIIQNNSLKVPDIVNWTYRSSGNTGNGLANPLVTSGLPGGVTTIQIYGISYNDPYGYMTDNDGAFCMVGRRNNTDTTPAIIICNNSGNSLTYIASPVNFRLNSVAISLTSDETTSRFFACGVNGAIIYSDDKIGSSWTAASFTGSPPSIEFQTIATKTTTNKNSTIIAAGNSGVVYRATKDDNLPTISNFAASTLTGTVSNIIWKKVISVTRTDTDIDWLLVGYDTTSGDTPKIYYSTDDGLNFSELSDVKKKQWVHYPNIKYQLLAGITSVPSASLTPSDTNTGNKQLPIVCFGGQNIWFNYKANSGLDLYPILAKISDVETPYSSSQIYTKYFETKPVNKSDAIQNRPISGLLELDGYYHKNIIPNFETPYKHFFGFGEGISFQFAQTPFGGFSDTTKFPDKINLKGAPKNITWDMYDGWEERGPESVKIYGGILRGWHYGIYNGIETKTKLIYRKNHFGYFRDILEQRQLTATIFQEKNSTAKTIFFPIENTFVSGTAIYNQAIDYVTATNPDYNPYDSGIYDYYCRSGQPFFDRDNED
jgi:hypothetical protein